MLLGQAERRLGLADKLAAVIADPAQSIADHPFAGQHLRARILARCVRLWSDADDLDHLRKDPAFKLACGRLPDTGHDLCSQPTMSRWEDRADLARNREAERRPRRSFIAPVTPRRQQAVTLDIDDTCDVAHGHQQLLAVQRASVMSVAFFRSMFTTPRPDAPWRSFCGQARRSRPARKCAAICAESSAASAHIGRRTKITIRGDGITASTAR